MFLGRRASLDVINTKSGRIVTKLGWRTSLGHELITFDNRTDSWKLV